MKIRRKYQQNGYTLIELLAVMIVLIAVGVIITSIIASSLRGSNKSASVNEVRQAGNFTLSQMAKAIAYSRSFDGVSDGTIDPDTGQLIYASNCTSSGNTKYYYLKISSFSSIQTTYACLDSPTASLTANMVSLIDTSKFNIKDCYFICSQKSVSVWPTININLDLEKNTNSTFVENKESQHFETTVGFRNNGSQL